MGKKKLKIKSIGAIVSELCVRTDRHTNRHTLGARLITLHRRHAFGRQLKLFSAIQLFTKKMSRFFAYFELDKMRCAQHQVELRRLGNQLPVLGKANSLCKIVKCCVFCMFVSWDLVQDA